MIIEEKLYNKMPPEIKACFNQLPNPSSDEVVSLFPNTGGGHWSYKQKKGEGVLELGLNDLPDMGTDKDKGSAARFFYCAKASKSERNMGCEGLEEITKGSNFGNDGARPHTKPDYKYEGKTRNNHPTVKPVALMEYLIKLVSREGALILDPFAGSGSTLVACKNLNRKYIGIEKEPEYIKIIEARLNSVTVENQGTIF